MPINKNELTKEMLAKAMQCETADELIALAKAGGYEVTEEDAEAYLKELEDYELDKSLVVLCYGIPTLGKLQSNKNLLKEDIIMPINKNELTKEQIAKAMSCETAEELMVLAKTEGIELTKEEAEAYLIELSDVELDSDALKNVAGGGTCYTAY